jgi:hypothetical protein
MGQVLVLARSWCQTYLAISGCLAFGVDEIAALGFAINPREVRGALHHDIRPLQHDHL